MVPKPLVDIYVTNNYFYIFFHGNNFLSLSLSFFITVKSLSLLLDGQILRIKFKLAWGIDVTNSIFHIIQIMKLNEMNNCFGTQLDAVSSTEIQ